MCRWALSSDCRCHMQWFVTLGVHSSSSRQVLMVTFPCVSPLPLVHNKVGSLWIPGNPSVLYLNHLFWVRLGFKQLKWDKWRVFWDVNVIDSVLCDKLRSLQTFHDDAWDLKRSPAVLAFLRHQNDCLLIIKKMFAYFKLFPKWFPYQPHGVFILLCLSRN